MALFRSDEYAKSCFRDNSVFMEKQYNLEINNVKRLKLGEQIKQYIYFIGNVLIFVQ